MKIFRRFSVFLLLTVGCGTTQFPGASSEPPGTVPSPDDPRLDQESSFWDHFVDDQDGAVDVGKWLELDAGFLPLVLPITEPAVGFGLVGGLVFVHRDKGDDPKIPPSLTALIGGGTENGTWVAAVAHQGVWNDGDTRYLGAAALIDANLAFYGIGNPPVIPGLSIPVNFDGWFLIQEVKFRLGKSHFFMGPDYQYTEINTTLSFEGLPPGFGIKPARLTSRTSGLGLMLGFDTRDNAFTPNKGVDAVLGARLFDEAIGSQTDYFKARAHFRGWVESSDELIWGLRLDADYTGDKAPLYDMSWIKLRGVPAFRYVDNFAVVAEVEPRIKITDRWSAVLFGGAGFVADEAGRLGDEDLVYAYGAGIRYLLAREMGMWAGFDVAQSNEDTAFYITVGSAWLR